MVIRTFTLQGDHRTVDGIGDKISEFGDKLDALGDRLADADSLSEILVEVFGSEDVVDVLANYAGDVIAAILVRLPYETLVELVNGLKDSA